MILFIEFIRQMENSGDSMDIHLIVKLKSSYSEWHTLFVGHTSVREKVCDESRTLVAKADDKTALVTLFNVDMAAMGAMMESPDFKKLTEDHVEEHTPYVISPLAPPNS